MESGNLDPRSQALQDWVKAELLVRRLAGEPVHRDAQCGLLPRVKHPAVLVQASLQETFRPNSPLEVFSDAQPRFRPQSQEEEKLIPIDELLGQYNYKKRSIEIFAKNIIHFAESELKCDVGSLEYIVRIHEYAHALLHLGVSWDDEPLLIRNYTEGQRTDWKPFLRARSRAFKSLRSESHEFIAQLISWVALGVAEPLSERKQLQELFVSLMKRQPAKYVLSDEVLGKSLYGDPTLLLVWARDPVRRRPPTGKGMCDAGEELLRCGSENW
jgi:hypothetical protein